MPKKTSAPLETDALADYMCFAIYTANLAFSRVYRPVLVELGVTYPQYVAIISLWEEDRQTVKSLSEKLFLEPSTTTPMLQKLEAMGYITRVRDGDDERYVRLSLTASGRRLREKGLGYGQRTVKATGLAEDEFRVLQKAISKLRDNLMSAAKEED
ncbi:MarR family transcriptional regulator [Bradyrhizobium sp. Arg68]|uniref:MarR family winged helix-turn-helix transcriptional regulator n=1 Tax=Bradyrhizobium ivorense TaxID=2511166 RepID=UPI001E3C467E|nr:MarR family transcriptional regulator [Bradyrhizobium ivorense]MCC8938525.1 MarR family transcriptional regulator [Bradyrhizobium ivorense]